VGIETGPVVVDASGEIYGDAPNTAALVQALAEPGSVVVTAQVQRQIAGLFVAEERGTHDLKACRSRRCFSGLYGQAVADAAPDNAISLRLSVHQKRGSQESRVIIGEGQPGPIEVRVLPASPSIVPATRRRLTPSQLRFFGGVIVQPARIKAVMMIRASLVKSTGPSIFIGGSKSTAGIVTSFIDCRYFNASGGKLATILRVSSSIFLSSIPFTPCCEWAENRA
jgi:hypothetical protein